MGTVGTALDRTGAPLTPPRDVFLPLRVDVSPCSVEGCDRNTKARGWCGMHYNRWKRHGDPTLGRPVGPVQRAVCSVEGCDKTAEARGWCRPHYGRWRNYGDLNVSIRGQRCEWNPWTGKVPCPQCGSTKWTMPYHPGDRRWLCIECPGVFEVVA